MLPEWGEPERLPLSRPLSTFFSANTRAGCRPCRIIDLYGILATGEPEVCYAQLELAG